MKGFLLVAPFLLLHLFLTLIYILGSIFLTVILDPLILFTLRLPGLTFFLRHLILFLALSICLFTTLMMTLGQSSSLQLIFFGCSFFFRSNYFFCQSDFPLFICLGSSSSRNSVRSFCFLRSDNAILYWFPSLCPYGCWFHGQHHWLLWISMGISISSWLFSNIACCWCHTTSSDQYWFS